MIKAIFFDFDGVLTTDAKASLTISKNLCAAIPGLSVDDVLRCYREDIELLHSGRRPIREVWARVLHTCKIPADAVSLPDILRRVPRNDVMFDLARSLASRFVLGIITDSFSERMDLLEDALKLRELFDPIVVSAVEHATKNDGTTRIFDVALAGARCRAEEAIFIDNQAKNLVTPAAMSMKTYRHDDAANDVVALRKALRRWGVA